MTDTLQSGTGGDLKDTAQQKAQDVVGQAKDKAKGAATPVTQGLKSQIDTRTTAAGEGIAGIAEIARSAGEQMREKGQTGPAQYADRAAEYVERLGGYLRDADADRMLKDVEGVARKQPALITGGSLVLGFLAARFLRASSEGRSGVDQSYRGDYTPTAELTSGYAEADRSFREVSDRAGTSGTSDFGTSDYGTTGVGTAGLGASDFGTSDLGTSDLGTTGIVRPVGTTGGGTAADVELGLGTTGVRPGDIGLSDDLADPEARR